MSFSGHFRSHRIISIIIFLVYPYFPLDYPTNKLFLSLRGTRTLQTKQSKDTKFNTSESIMNFQRKRKHLFFEKVNISEKIKYFLSCILETLKRGTIEQVAKRCTALHSNAPCVQRVILYEAGGRNCLLFIFSFPCLYK